YWSRTRAHPRKSSRPASNSASSCKWRKPFSRPAWTRRRRARRWRSRSCPPLRAATRDPALRRRSCPPLGFAGRQVAPVRTPYGVRFALEFRGVGIGAVGQVGAVHHPILVADEEVPHLLA